MRNRFYHKLKKQNKYVGGQSSKGGLASATLDFESSSLNQTSFYDIFQHSPSAMALLQGKEHIVKSSNDEFQKLFGELREIKNVSIENLWPELKEEGYVDLLNDALQGETYIGKELEFHLERDGANETLYFDITLQPVYGSDDDPVGVFFQGINVTDKVCERIRRERRDIRYKSLFDKMGQGFGLIEIIYDKQKAVDYKFIEVNPKFQEITGLSPEGKTATQVFPYVDKKWLDRYQNVAESGKAIRFTEQEASMNSWFEVEAFRVDNESAQIAILLTDISERISSQKELENVKEQLSVIVENAVSGMLLYDLNGEIIRANKMGAYFQGYDSLDELWGKDAQENIDQFFNRFDVYDESGNRYELDKAPTTQVFQDKELAEDVLLLVHKQTSEKKWVLVSAKRIKDNNDKTEFILITTTDISIQKEAAIVKHEKEKLFRMYTEAMPQMAFIANTDGSIRYYNKRWYEFLGNDSDTKGWKWKDQPLHHPEDLERTIKRWKKSIESGRPYEIEYRLRRYDGKYVWHLGRAEPIRDSTGEITMWLGTNTDIHQQKLAQEALKNSEAYFRSMADNIPVLLWLTNKDSKCVYLNNKWKEYTGQPIKNGLGHEFKKFIHPEDLVKTEPEYKQAYQQKAPFKVEYRLKNKEGKYEWHYDSGVPRFNDEGEFAGYIGTVVNIQERKMFESAIQKSQERFKTIADNISQLAWMTDSEGNVTWYNKRWYDYTGTTLNEVKGWDWTKVHHPDHVDQVVKKIQKAFQEGTLWEDTFPIKGADGNYRWFLSRAVPIRNENGEILHWFGTNTDITDLQRAEDKLKYQRSLLSAQQQVSPLGILVVSPNNETITYNDRFLKIFELTRDEMEVDKRETAQEKVQKMISGYDKFIENAKKIHDSGEKHYDRLNLNDGRILERYGSPILGDNNVKYGYVWFFMDITEKENLLRQKDDFLGIASHELKTPITSLKGYTQFLQEKFEDIEDEESTLHILTRMDTQLDKITDLIGDLLDVTKIEQGKLQFKEEDFDFNELVHEIIDEVQRSSYRHTINLNLDESVEIKRADRNRIGQVIINFLTNAIKYSPKADHVEVSTKVHNDTIVLEVEDYGVGIDEKDLTKVFDRFYRVESSGYETFSGLGLGLHISKEIIDRHKGKIGVRSKPKEGSTFYFTLPVEN